MTAATLPSSETTARNTPRQVAIASLVGTAIEFYDYYAYGTAAVLVFSTQFFPKGDPAAATLLSLSTLALAFLARPIGSALFGHFGDRIGRKRTLVASLLTMGVSTAAIGLLPTYDSIGLWAPILLCLFRIGQGIGLGGEWGGAALVATENAPPGKRGWYGTFPQLGAPIGLFTATAGFFLVSYFMGAAAMVAWGWRLLFVLSFVLVAVGLYVRLNLHESQVFRQAEQAGRKLQAPVSAVLLKHPMRLLQGVLIMTTTYVVFYLMTAFVQVYSKSPVGVSAAGHPTGLGIPANVFTGFLLVGAIMFGIFTSISGICADRIGRRRWLMGVTVALMAFGLSMNAFLDHGTPNSVFAFVVVGFALVGSTFGPMAALLPEMFPTEVRYSGASLAYNIASITGASVPAIGALELNKAYGLWGVSLYFAANCLLTLAALYFSRETRDLDLTRVG